MTLYNEYDGEKTIQKLMKKKELYPKLIQGFAEWLNTYTKKDRNKLYNLNNKSEYAKAIIHYISGMTDKYAIDTYNEIISF